MESDISLPGTVSNENENVSKTVSVDELKSGSSKDGCQTNVYVSAKKNTFAVPVQTKNCCFQGNTMESDTSVNSTSRNGCNSTVHSLGSTSLQDLRSSLPITHGCNLAMCTYLVSNLGS